LETDALTDGQSNELDGEEDVGGTIPSVIVLLE
jgi:hypothetical protein